MTDYMTAEFPGVDNLLPAGETTLDGYQVRFALDPRVPDLLYVFTASALAPGPAPYMLRKIDDRLYVDDCISNSNKHRSQSVALKLLEKTYSPETAARLAALWAEFHRTDTLADLVARSFEC